MERAIQKIYRRIVLSSLILLALMCGVSWIFTAYVRNQDAALYTSLVKKDLLLGDYRNSMVQLRAAVVRDFKNVQFVNSEEQEVFALGVSSTFYSMVRLPVQLTAGAANSSQLLFQYNPWWNLFLTFLVWLTVIAANVPILAAISKRLERFFKKREEEKYLAKTGATYRQLAHDIRSPLTALNALCRQMSIERQDQKSILLQAINRLEGIAEDVLSQKSRGTEVDQVNERLKSEVVSVTSAKQLSSLLKENVDLKSFEWFGKKPVRFSLELSGVENVFAEPVTLNRMISNVFNNSFEAGASAITVSSLRDQKHLLLELRDNGAGIPDDILQEIYLGETISSKSSGNGLGLQHARKTLESWGGKLGIHSTVGIGTTIIFRLLVQSEPV